MQSRPEQLAIVQRMIDAGEPEEAIASVIQHFKKAPETAKPKDSNAQVALQRSGLATIGDFVVGALKGGGETAINLGRMIRSIPGSEQALGAMLRGIPGAAGLEPLASAPVSDFNAAKAYTQPTNTTQAIGKGAEQIAEVMGAGGVVGAASRAIPRLAGRMAVEGAAGAAMSAAQGGNPTAGGLMAAAVPVVGKVVSSIPGRLKTQAADQVMQALGPTKERYKATAAKITPELLRRGMTGSRESLKAQAAEMVEQVGGQIDEAITAYGARQASTAPILDALEASKAPFIVQSGGKAVPLDKRALRQIQGLQDVMADVGDTATVDQLIGVRRAWDKIVSQAGGYQQRAGGAIGVPLADQSEAAVKRIGANAIRKVLDAEVPELSAINKEFAFWKSLDDVLTQTLQRTQPQQGGIGRKIMQGAGAVVGASAGSAAGPMGTLGAAGLGAGAARIIERVVTSPHWKLTSAKLKDQLADALASGNPTRVIDTLGRITSVQASKVGR